MERPAAMSPDPMSTELPDLLYTEAESDLRQAVRSLFSVRCSYSDLLARTESNQTYDTSLWHALAAELGCSGLLIPESAGGAGASYREAAVVAEEAGRAVAPVPYLGSAVVATAALLAAVGAEPTAEEDRKLLAALADGTLTAALAVPFESSAVGRLSGQESRVTRQVQPSIRVVGPANGDQPGSARLTGTASRLADTLPADVLLVPGDGVPFALYVVDAKADGVTRTPAVSLDQTRQLCELRLDNVPARRIAGGDTAAAAVRTALLAGAAMLASEQLGVAEQCLEMTVAYAKERRQFARQIGSFQAIKHRLADLWVAVTQARAAARYAAACLADDSPDSRLAVSLAKAYCGDVAVKAAEECVQLHGGIGFTWEHPAHLYLKRAKSASIGFGTPDRHRAALADLADLPGPDGGAGA
jgi:alkylation response protein AidB-like acyl-CoA dehydrogenase